MTPMDLVVIFLWEHVIALLTTAIVVLLKRRWKIPVVILRYTGDKRRPVVIITKARKVGVGLMQGVRRLIVKGYKMPMRDFKSENYYPSARGASGALILWEFKSGWLTPVIPKKVLMRLSDEQRYQIETALQFLEDKSTVKFAFNEEVFAELMQEAINDVDAEYFLREQQRQDAQYTGGLKDFLMKHGGAIAIVIVACVILVGYIVYLDKVPSVVSQCIDAGVEAAKNTYLKTFANNVSMGGVPLG